MRNDGICFNLFHLEIIESATQITFLMKYSVRTDCILQFIIVFGMQTLRTKASSFKYLFDV